MKFSLEQFRKASTEYNILCAAADNALYELCHKFPNHQQRDGTHAKVLIIGRSYSTGIERKIKSTGAKESSLNQLSDHMWKNRDRVDAILHDLTDIREPLTPAKLGKILTAHGQLMEVIKVILRNKQSPRSFVSKYLHFHRPSVPIFDSVTSGQIKKLKKRKRNVWSFPIPKGADEYYSDYIERFWQLYQEVRDSGEKTSVKLLDNYLFEMGRKQK